MENMNRNIFEGWTPQCFVDVLEPTVDMVMKGQSWWQPFKNKDELKTFLRDEQPYYKKDIPEVIKYFSKKYGIK
jgi:hypothetical protein